MAMDLNDGFFDEDELLEDEVDESSTSQDDNSNVDDGWRLDEKNDTLYEDDNDYGFDAVKEYLRDNGIQDSNRIKFYNEDGSVEEKAWEDLSSIEQLNILRSGRPEPEDALDESEIVFLNKLRANGISPDEYEDYIMRHAAAQGYNLASSEFENTQPEQSFTSDQLTDDELFILDLEARVEDLTDDEILQALLAAKENPELYQKQMRGIRSEYERLETEQRERQEAEIMQQQRDAYNLYSGSIIEEITNLDGIGDLDITMDSDDMDELAHFILGSDEAGNNYFMLAIQDPNTLVRMAWFALHGEEVLNGISQYYNLQIADAHKNGYYSGVDAYDLVLQNQHQSSFAYRPKETNTKLTIRNYRSVDDLFED